MKTHELAKILLNNQDLPLSTHANNHTSNDNTRVCLMKVFGGDIHICIGNISNERGKYPNTSVIEVLSEHES